MPPKNKHAAPDSERYFFEVFGKVDLRGDWQGWKIRGRELVSPDGDRINYRRLRGLLFTQSLRAGMKKKAACQGVGAAPAKTFAIGCTQALRQARAQGV